MRNGRLEMGRRLLKLLGSEPGFFRIGVTAADLRDEGTEPEVREKWMMAVIRGSREGREAITREDGRGSSWQVDGLDFRMSFNKSGAEGSMKEERGTESGWWGTKGGEQLDVRGASCWWMVAIFELKNDIRELQLSVE